MHAVTVVALGTGRRLPGSVRQPVLGQLLQAQAGGGGGRPAWVCMSEVMTTGEGTSMVRGVTWLARSQAVTLAAGHVARIAWLARSRLRSARVFFVVLRQMQTLAAEQFEPTRFWGRTHGETRC